MAKKDMQSDKKKLKWWQWLLIVLAVLVVLIIIIALFSGDSSVSNKTVSGEQNKVESSEPKIDGSDSTEDTAGNSGESEESKESEETEPSEEKPAESDKALKLNEEIEFPDFKLTVKGFDYIEDDYGAQVVRVTYDWENTSDKPQSPFMTFNFKGFQDGIETEYDMVISDKVDLGKGQKELKPGAKLEGAHAVIGVDDPSKPLDIELDELITFDSYPYTFTIQDIKNMADLSADK